MKSLRNLREVIAYFSDPDVCLNFIKQMRWPDGVRCLSCQSKEISFLSTRRIWKCKGCSRQFSAKVGTIFEDSPIGFEKWLPALWLIANSKIDISSYELHRILGVTQKTAWLMMRRIRLAVESGSIERMSTAAKAKPHFMRWLASHTSREAPNKGKMRNTRLGGRIEHMANIKQKTLRTENMLNAEVYTGVLPFFRFCERQDKVDPGLVLLPDKVGKRRWQKHD